jgi:hypothetical protein
VEECEVEETEAGVIKDARRRQRRQRLSVVLVAGGVAVIGAVGLTARGAHVAPLRRSAPLTGLTGAPLSGPTHLRLVVSENTGPASILDVDTGKVRAVPALGVPRQQRTWGPALYPLAAVPGGAVAVVTRQNCARCTITKTDFLIRVDGSVRRTSTLTLGPDPYASAQVLDSASVSWVLTRPRGGHCTLRLEPGKRPALAVPCGDLGVDTPAGLIIQRGSRVVLVDPWTGQVRARFAVHGQFDVLSSHLALTSTSPGIPGEGDAFPTQLTIVNLSTGARLHLRWPSILRFGYRVFPEPGGPLVAIQFADPSHPGGQASDLWLLNTRTGKFTHVPGFPILDYLKFSGIAWTSDHRLVAVAQGGGRTTIGVWRPGSGHLRVGTVPHLAGYSQLVPLVTPSGPSPGPGPA